MITIKSFLFSPNLQFDMVLKTGVPSGSLILKLEGLSNKKSVDKALLEQGISIDVEIVDFKIRAIQELVGWAVSVERFLKKPLFQVIDLLKHKHSDSLLSKFTPDISGVRSIEDQTSTLSVETTRALIIRVDEIIGAHPDWQFASVEDLQHIFSQEVFKGITLNLGDYIELGAPKKPIYRSVMNEIVQQLSTDVGTWQMPWRVDKSLALPRNVISRKCYSGFNIVWLWQVAENRRYSTHIWATRNQWTQLGATILPGEVATPVFKIFSISGNHGETDIRMAIVPLYNAAQVKGWEPKTKHNDNVNPVQKAERFVKKVNPKIREDSNAFFDQDDNYIGMPPMSLFKSTEGYYGTLLHELIHWTGHETRKNREFDRFGSPTYAKEELIAELGAAFLCAELGVVNSPRPDHAQYIDFWIKDINKKHRTLIWAAAKASQAIDCLKDLR
jgi:antirestriction protein ArdC